MDTFIPSKHIVQLPMALVATYPGSQWEGRKRAWYTLLVHYSNFLGIGIFSVHIM